MNEGPKMEPAHLRIRSETIDLIRVVERLEVLKDEIAHGVLESQPKCETGEQNIPSLNQVLQETPGSLASIRKRIDDAVDSMRSSLFG